MEPEMQNRISHVNLRTRGGIELLSLEQFLDIDFSMRAVLIVDGVVEFLDSDGQDLPLADALGTLREIRRRSSAPPPPAPRKH